MSKWALIANITHMRRQCFCSLFFFLTAAFIVGCSGGEFGVENERSLGGASSSLPVAAGEPPPTTTLLNVKTTEGLLAVKVDDQVELRWLKGDLTEVVSYEEWRIEASRSNGQTWVDVNWEKMDRGRVDEHAILVTGLDQGGEYVLRITQLGVTNPPLLAVPVSACEASGGVIASLREKLSVTQVGVADYEGYVLADVPKATAALLMAEVKCLKSVPSHDRQLMNSLGEHLLAWPSAHPSDQFGWGLPFAWDAFGDGTENAPNTVYSISTALSVQALLDWSEVADYRIRQRVLTAVDTALQEWVRPESSTPFGQLAYSLSPHDSEFDVFNSSAMLAGQMQRYASMSAVKNTAYTDIADQVMRSLLEYRRSGEKRVLTRLEPGQRLEDLAAQLDVDPVWFAGLNGYFGQDTPQVGEILKTSQVVDTGQYWGYSSQEETPNDLAHAGYIVEGITNYVSFGGVLGEEFTVDEIVEHLSSFESKNLSAQEILGWPRWRFHELTREQWRFARLYDIGWVLFLSGNFKDELASVRQSACADGLSYRQDGNKYLKYPRYAELEGSPNPEIFEYMAYFYLGQTSAPCSYSYELEDSKRSLVVVPFTTLGDAENSPVDVWVDTKSGANIIEFEERRMILPIMGVPVAVAMEEDRVVALVRQSPSGALAFVDWTGVSPPVVALLSGQEEELSLGFRSFLRSGDKLYIIVYDNKTLENRLQAYSWLDLILVSDQPLASFEPEAGHTYEMEPPVTLQVTLMGEVEVFAGTLHAILKDGQFISGRLLSCSKILEVVQGYESSTGVLCEANDYLEDSWPDRLGGFRLVIVGKESLEWIEVDSIGVPFDLRFNPITQDYEWSDSATESLSSFLRFEILSGQANGMFELGANNREGRVAWSQVYYLEGFLDLLDGSVQRVAGSAIAPGFLADLTVRFAMEVRMLNEVICRDGYESLPFTVNREPATFAVQTSRIALLYGRVVDYRPILAEELRCMESVARSSAGLEGHIEELTDEGIVGWINPNVHYLKWPKGSAFPFDGLNVAYNHQNEWALGVLDSAWRFDLNEEVLVAAKAILSYFYTSVLIPEGGGFPTNGRWPYWWGTAREGWSATDEVSVNMPTYAGDYGDAWISFRTIDATAMIEWAKYLEEDASVVLLESLSGLIESGQVLPQLAGKMDLVNRELLVEPPVLGRFGRASSPAEFPEAIWAHVLTSAGSG